MKNNIINFEDLKKISLERSFPNVKEGEDFEHSDHVYESDKAFEKFQEAFFRYEDRLSNIDSKSKVTLDEVLVLFNKYFDEIYKEYFPYDSEKVPIFKEALDYSMLSNGKRLRPFLMVCFFYFCDGYDVRLLMPFMLAIEMIHTFSLIHDDLPCMDNDELRRGKPTVWKKYGEDMAVLVGDALAIEAQTILFRTVGQVASLSFLPSALAAAMVISEFTGIAGMITGQVFDVQNTNNEKLTLNDINFMYEKKTSALLIASILSGAYLAGKQDDKTIMSLTDFGDSLGKAYQIQDDLLEIESTTEEIGKSVNSDKDKGKVTYVTIEGIEKSKKDVDKLFKKCLKIIDDLTTDKNKTASLVLKDVVEHILGRKK